MKVETYPGVIDVMSSIEALYISPSSNPIQSLMWSTTIISKRGSDQETIFSNNKKVQKSHIFTAFRNKWQNFSANCQCFMLQGWIIEEFEQILQKNYN